MEFESLSVNVSVFAGRDFIAPCKCKGTSKYVHRECLDHWRSVKVNFLIYVYALLSEKDENFV